MPRIRTVKPEFWLNEELSAISAEAALLAVGILNHSDDEGYFKANPALLKAAIFPLREISVSIHELIKELSTIDYIEVVTSADNKKYGRVKKFSIHQKINRPTPSKIKDLAQFTEPSVSPQEQLTAGKERKGKEGNDFIPPTLDEVKQFIKEKNYKIDAERFICFYGSKGWMVGKNKMKDWKLALLTWHLRDEKENKVEFQAIGGR